MKFIQRVINAGVYLIIVTIPISFILRVSRGEFFRLQLKVSLFDILIPLVFILWMFRTLALKEHKEMRFPAAPVAAFMIVSILSIVNAMVVLNSFKELIQVFEYFLLGYLLFSNNIKTGAQLRKVVHLLLGITAIVVIYGAYQYAVLDGESYLVGSTFDDRNVLGGYLSIILPLFFGLLFVSSAVMRTLYAAVILGGLAVITSIPSFLVTGVTFIIMGLAKRKNARFTLSVSAVFVIIALLPLGFTLNDIRESRSLFYEPGGLDDYHAGLVRSVKMSYFGSIFKRKSGDHELELLSSMVTPKFISAEYIEEQFNARRKDITFGSGGHITQRFMEWQAALNGLTERPLLGVGIGNYQSEVGRFYRSLPKLKTMEPDSQNGYLVTLISTGLAGLVVFLWILFHFFRRSIENYHAAGDDFTKGMSLGLLGSLIAFSLNNLFSPLIYQNTVVLFILVLSLIGIMGSYPGGGEAGHGDEISVGAP